jgi:hypothetical protein
MNNCTSNLGGVRIIIRTLVIMKFLLVCIAVFLLITPIKAQKGLNISFSTGYRMPLGSSPDNNNILGGGTQYSFIPVITSFGKGFYATLGGGYTNKRGIEFGGLITYQQGLTKAILDDSLYSKVVYKSNSYTFTPYIRLRKSVSGPFIPYIHFGLPITFAQATIDNEYKTQNQPTVSYQNKYARQVAIGINGGLGFYSILNNHWQLFTEVSFIGLKVEPKKVFTTNPNGQTTEKEVNTPEQRNVFGQSVVLPFSSWGFGLGIRYNFTKMIENL